MIEYWHMVHSYRLRAFVIFLLCFCFVVGLPSLSMIHAQGLVPCGNQADATSSANSCDYKAFVQLLKNILDFMYFAATLVTVGLVAHTGFLYLTAGSKPGQLEAAKKRFATVGIGFVLMLGSWLIIKTLVDLLISDALRQYNPLK